MIRMAEVAEEGEGGGTGLHAGVFDIFALFFVVFGYSWGNTAAGLGLVRRGYGRQCKG